MAQLHSVSERLGLARSVQLRESLVATVPLVVGWLRPMILLPSSVISGLSVKQLEMILAHELAHIRRHDYLVNLLQSVIETLLFYHPAVWWVSRQIRKEREHCCDDLAVKVCGGDKQSYARTLADLDDLRTNVQFVQAITGGSLLKRILRLADRAMPKSLEPRQWLAGLSMVAVSVVLFTIIGVNLTVAQDAVTLRLAVTDPLGRPSEAYINEFIAQVKTLSDGKITIEPTWEAGANTTPTFEQGVAKALVDGQYDLGLAASRGWDSVGVTSLQPLQAPFLINNDALAEAVAASDIAAQMLEGMSSVGVVGLTLWPDVLNHPMSFDFEKPFLSPEDFSGKTIRIIGSNITSAMYDAFGATALVKEDWYPDVEAGLIQGTELGLAQGFAMPAQAVATGNVIYYPKYHVLVVNSASFERLSDEQQGILREAAAVIQQQAIAEHSKEVDAATTYCTNGGTIVMASDEQLAAFDEAVKPVYALIEQDPQNATYIAAIRDLKANTTPSAGAEACAPVVSTYSGATPPNGVYSIDVTKEELMAKGASPGFADGNAGSTSMAFEDGTMQMHWESGSQSMDCTWTYTSTEGVLHLNLPANTVCSYETDLVIDTFWRVREGGGLEFLVLSTNRNNNQDLVDIRAIFERTYQKIE
jgi:TRAP-type transport system periplasmic protein